MRREILMGIVTAILLGACVFIYYNNSLGTTFFAVFSESETCRDMGCLSNSLVSCTPAKVEWESVAEEGTLKSSLEVVGIIDNFCVFKMTRADSIVRECYFKQDILSAELAEQFLKGKDNGFGQVIADSCK